MKDEKVYLRQKQVQVAALLVFHDFSTEQLTEPQTAFFSGPRCGWQRRSSHDAEFQKLVYARPARATVSPRMSIFTRPIPEYNASTTATSDAGTATEKAGRA